KGEIIFFQNNFISLHLIIIGFFFVGIGLILKIYFRAEVTWSAICMYGNLLYSGFRFRHSFLFFFLRIYIVFFLSFFSFKFLFPSIDNHWFFLCRDRFDS